MDFITMLRGDAEGSDREGLRRSLLEDNIRKGKILAWVVIAFELCFAAMDIGASLLKANNEFHFSLYLAMYLAMILINMVFLFLARGLKDISALPEKQIKIISKYLVLYITVMMCWGSGISLMDQKLYGQIIVFMVNVITCSVIFCLSHRQIVIPYACSCVILLAGLPFFQASPDVLVGHYVNLCFFIFISWTASRIAYARYCSDYKSRMLLVNANAQLEHEIELNKAVNMLLADANKQLRKLSLVDELTNIPNRRSFRNYIDAMFTGPMRDGMTFSVVMMDLDNFKEYNDNYGHVEADRVLSMVAGQIQSMVRHSMDIAARWGGEEFIYAAFDMAAEQAAEVAESIMNKVLDLQIPHAFSKASSFVTVSAGYCTMEIQGKSDVSICIEKADKAMYKAKSAGKNRSVEFAG